MIVTSSAAGPRSAPMRRSGLGATRRHLGARHSWTRRRAGRYRPLRSLETTVRDCFGRLTRAVVVLLGASRGALLRYTGRRQAPPRPSSAHAGCLRSNRPWPRCPVTGAWLGVADTYSTERADGDMPACSGRAPSRRWQDAVMHIVAIIKLRHRVPACEPSRRERDLLSHVQGDLQLGYHLVPEVEVPDDRSRGDRAALY